MVTNYKVRINPAPADYYRSNDIPNMPDHAGTWIMSAEQLNYVRDIICQDLERWLLEPSEWQDRNEIAAWRRQIANLINAKPTEEEVAPPAKREATMNKLREREEFMEREIDRMLEEAYASGKLVKK
jgi:hypothetical protein